MECNRPDSTAIYIHGIERGGKPFAGYRIHHNALLGGEKITFTLGKEPKK